MKKILFIALLAMMLSLGLSGAAMWDLGKIITGQEIIPDSGGPWLSDDSSIFFGNGKDAGLKYNSAMDKIYLNDTAIYLEEAVTAPGGITGPVTGALTGTASRIALGTFIDTSYGLQNATTNKAQINLASNKGLEFSTGALAVKLADASLALSASGVAVKSAALKNVLADGTASAASVTVAGMAVGDELISVHAQATKSNATTITDRTAEYAIGAGVLTKAGGTSETGNQLEIWFWDRT